MGASNSPLANSAVYGGSMLIRSMPESCASRRRASCTRCWLASCGSVWVVIVYWSVLQVAAMAAWPPLSGLMYQTSVVLPLPPPQAVRTPAAVARAAREPATRRRVCDRPEDVDAPRDRLGMCMVRSLQER